MSAALAIGLLQWRHADAVTQADRSISALDNMHQARLRVMRAYLISRGAEGGNATFAAADALAALERATLSLDDWLSGRLVRRSGRQTPLLDPGLRHLIVEYRQGITAFRERLTDAAPRSRDVEVRAAFTALENQAGAISHRTSAALSRAARREERNHAITIFLVTFFILTSGGVLHGFSHRRDDALAAMKQSESRLRTVMAQLPALTWITDLDLRITSIGGALLPQLFAGSEDDLIGRPIHDFPEIRDSQAVPAHRAALHGSSASYTFAFVGRRFDVRVEPLSDRSRRIVGVLAVAVDVSDQERLETQLRQAQRMEAVGRLAGGVAHDFNNLLTVIQSYTTFAAEQLTPDSPAQGDLSEVQHAADRAAGLTRQLLAFSRQQILQPRHLDLNDSVTRVVSMLRRVIGEDIEIETRLGAMLFPVHADAGQMEQVIMNLAVNARDAMPAGGVLTISTRAVDVDERQARERVGLVPGQYAEIVIDDTGTGMPPDVLARIFEPFYTTKGAGTGTGLGLSMVYGIVKQSDGFVYADSIPGEGTQFIVLLPRAEAVDGPPAAVVPHATQQRGTGTILLVEDDDKVRAVVRRQLEQQGYQVLAASDADEALRYAGDDGRTIDLVLTDVVMPGINGRMLADRIIARRPAIRLVFMSGYTDDEILRRGLTRPGTVLLDKPFTAEQLVETIRRALG